MKSILKKQFLNYNVHNWYLTKIKRFNIIQIKKIAIITWTYRLKKVNFTNIKLINKSILIKQILIKQILKKIILKKIIKNKTNIKKLIK